MEAILEYWGQETKTVVAKSGFRYRDSKSVIKSTETIEGTAEEIFRKFFKKNDRLIYCNGSYYKFQDIRLQSQYIGWLKSLDEKASFELYYGNGIVD